MLNGCKPRHIHDRRSWISGEVRRSCWRGLTPVRDDSLAGPGPSSIAAAAVRTAASTAFRRRVTWTQTTAVSAAQILATRHGTPCGSVPLGRFTNARLPLPPSATQQAAAAASPSSEATAAADGAAAQLGSRPSPFSRRRRRRAKASRSKDAEEAAQEGAHNAKADFNASSSGASANANARTGTGPAVADGEVSGTAGELRPPVEATITQGDASVSRNVRASRSFLGAEGGDRGLAQDGASRAPASMVSAASVSTVSAAVAPATATAAATAAGAGGSRPAPKSILDIAAAADSGSGGGGARKSLRNSGSGRAAAATAAAESSSDGAGDTDGNGDGGAASSPIRLPDGRQLIKVVGDTPSAAAASALSHALGVEQRGVVRFDGGAGALKGLRTLTLAHLFMGSYQRGLSFVVDVKQVAYGKPSPLDERPQSGDVSFMYRVMARARSLESCDKELPAAMRQARFLLDLSINVRQAWDMKGDVDEEQAYDLADTLYGALLAQQAEEDSELLLRQQHKLEGDEGTAAKSSLNLDRVPVDDVMKKRHNGRGQRQQEGRWRQQQLLPPRWIIVTADLGQGPTMLTALGLLQKRFREERQKAVAEATLYRASVAAPRLNGKDGWVFVIRLGFEGPYWTAYGRNRPPVPYSSAPTADAAAGATRWKGSEPESPSPPPLLSSSPSSPSPLSTASQMGGAEELVERRRRWHGREPSGRAGWQGTTAMAAATATSAKTATAADAAVAVAWADR